MALVRTTAKIVRKTNVSTDFWELDLKPAEEVVFESGQYISLKVDESGARRSYSIASRPAANPVELLVDVKPMGLGSKYVLGLRVGDEVDILAPLGRFTFGSSRKKDKLFVATGSGITPLRSMIEDLLMNKNETESVRLVWGMRYEADVFWKDKFDQLAQKYSNFSWELTLSKPGESWRGKTGRVGNCLDEDLKEGRLKIGECEVYMCGSEGMITETGAWLYGKGMEKADIHFEKFF